MWGAIKAHGLLPDNLVLSDDAGQFAVERHALCWVHAERLIHKLDTLTDKHLQTQQRLRSLVWWFYADLKAYRRDPDKRRRGQLRARFDRIFRRRTGFATLDRLLERLHANKDALLVVLDRPEVPLNTNGSERDLRPQAFRGASAAVGPGSGSCGPARGVTRRKISAGTRSDIGRDCRDGFLGLMKTCKKLGISFWNYLGSRFGVEDAEPVPDLAGVVRARCAA